MAKKAQWTDEDDALLAELGVEVAPQAATLHTPREERIIAGFEEIESFYTQQGRLPYNNPEADIFERLYAVRLAALRQSPECCAVLNPRDKHGLLSHSANALPELDDDALLDALGLEEAKPDDITVLKHVKPRAQVRAEAEEIAQRKPCTDFANFKPLFYQAQQELKAGIRVARAAHHDAQINQGDFYILGGQKAYIAEVGEWFQARYGNHDARLRVIFDNGTESNLLYRSFQKSLNTDKLSRRLSEPDAGPLFNQTPEDATPIQPDIGGDDFGTGVIYVLRSLSKQPDIVAHAQVLHKIGVTGGSVQQRISNAAKDPTFLMAEVEVVATYELYNIHRHKLEHLLHRFFATARLDIEIIDRFGQVIKPQEWFLVPLFVINEVIDKIRTGTLAGYDYDKQTAQLIKRPDHPL